MSGEGGMRRGQAGSGRLLLPPPPSLPPPPLHLPVSMSAPLHSFQAKDTPSRAQQRAEERRLAALRRQREGRQGQQDRLRALLLQGESSSSSPVSATPPPPTSTPAAEATPAQEVVTPTQSAPSRSRRRPARRAAPPPPPPSSSPAATSSPSLLHPSWLCSAAEAPVDAASHWLLLSRPEGTRCTVLARRGRTISRKKNGAMLHARFASSWPSGSGGGTHSSQASFHPLLAAGGGSTPVSVGEATHPATLLDCIYHPGNNGQGGRYFIVDCLLYHNYSLVDCSAEFRLWWIQAKMAELGAVVEEVNVPNKDGTEGSIALHMLTFPASAHSPFSFHLLESFPCTPAALSTLYPHDPRLHHLGVRQDGYLLLHRESHYEFGLSELCLQWKDAHCSAFLIDGAQAADTAAATTATSSSSLAPQRISLLLGPHRQLLSAEGVCLGTLDEFSYQTADVHEGDLLQFTIQGIREEEGEEAATSDSQQATEEKRQKGGAEEQDSSSPPPPFQLLQLTFKKRASTARSQTDPLSKIRFQAYARSQRNLTFTQLCESLLQQPVSQPTNGSSAAVPPSLSSSSVSAPSSHEMEMN